MTVIILIVVVGFLIYFSIHVFNLWQKVHKNNVKVLEDRSKSTLIIKRTIDSNNPAIKTKEFEIRVEELLRQPILMLQKVQDS
ncbi:hypothetical protein LAV79_18580 [Peribacillus butanolivorans]|uniref:hypothetical protein n=1 Tax=Peribacillus butanolivorans TaxID=421767 RepID=UPI0030C9BE21